MPKGADEDDAGAAGLAPVPPVKTEGALPGMGGWLDDDNDDDCAATAQPLLLPPLPPPLPPPPAESFSGVFGMVVILAWKLEVNTLFVAWDVVSRIGVSSMAPLVAVPLSPLAALRDALSACVAADALVLARNAPQASLLTRLDQHRLREDNDDGAVPAALESSRSFMRRGVFMNANRFSPDIIGEYGTMLS